jgi:3-isopropylmalate/(R)-2-methylmalate dehydratase small subunit
MEAFKRLTGSTLVLAQENIDTDQIIPARFLTGTDFEGLGEAAFRDWRYDADGQPVENCVLNEARVKNSPILVAGRNFGCGSSREHAPHALMGFGFRVVISCEIADIFRNNAANVGLLPIVVTQEQHWQLLQMDGLEITVDLANEAILLPGDRIFRFRVDDFARHCLLKGMDRLDFLLAEEAAIRTYEVQA